jgi:putative glutamine amidotransferase
MKTIWIIASYKKEDIDNVNRVAFEYVQVIDEIPNVLPIIIPCNTKQFEKYINLCDWFIIPWWDDIDPLLYWQDNIASRNTNKENDQFLLNAIWKIIENEKPLLWICKWHQLINVFFWGTLIQNIESKFNHYQYENQYIWLHNVNLIDNSALNNIYWTKVIKVNSIHHQAIWKLWDWLIVTWISENDKIIESI